MCAVGTYCIKTKFINIPCSFTRIKDLRTGVETGNTEAVLNGDLNQFIEASLKQGV